MHPMLNIAIQAARNAGKIIIRFLDQLDAADISEKSRHNFVTKVDKLAEQEIISTIHRSYPNHSIVAEESGTQNKDEKFSWIIDPLDGTTNYIHGMPHFAVSIALKINNRLEVAVVYDPLRQETFTATRGQGAHLNNRRIRVTPLQKLEPALLGTGFPVKDSELFDKYLNTFSSIFRQVSGIRRQGAASLDLAYVAAGRLDGFWEMALKPWDIAAGILLVREAGGMISDLTGGESYFESGNIVATNSKLHKPVVKLLQESLR